jgi:hypothetical protein
MRVINNRGKNREKPKGIEQRETEREMKKIADMKGVVGFVIKIATLYLLAAFRIRNINRVNVHPLNYVGHSRVVRWTHVYVREYSSELTT